MKPFTTISTRQNCQGMTLVEVLIAAVVIAIGLMGVAALQVTALQGASNADYRSRAIDLAAALSDRMHANLIGVDRESDDVTGSDYLIPVNCGGAICAMSPRMTNTTTIVDCDPQQMANFDLMEISCGTGLITSLPGGQLNVTCIDNDAADADGCSDLSPMLITVSWQLQNADNATEQVVMTVVPGAP